MEKTIEELVNEMIVMLEDCVVDAAKFDGGNKAAGTRVRKAMQEIKVAAQNVRETVSEIRNAEK